MFKFSFSNLIMISFGNAKRRYKYYVFDGFLCRFSALLPNNGVEYWFWSDDPPKKIEVSIADRELFNV